MTSKSPFTEEAVAQANEELERALSSNDCDWLAANMTADALFVHMDGRVESKEEFIEHLRAGLVRSISRKLGDVRIRMFGEVAVVTAWSRIHISGAGGEKHLNMRITRVFVCRSGQWLFVSNQSGSNTVAQET